MAAEGGKGFKRRMTSVGLGAAEGGKREIAPRSLVAINTSPPRLAFATTYLSRCVAREQNLTISLRHEAEGGIVGPENADHLGLGWVRALTPSCVLYGKNRPRQPFGEKCKCEKCAIYIARFTTGKS